MTDVIYLLNSASVGIFGMILSASFCDIVWTKRKRISLVVSMFMILLIQAIIYQQTSSDMVKVSVSACYTCAIGSSALYYES